MDVPFSAESVQQALDWLASRNGPLDIVFTDIRMPGTDGYSFARELKADERLRQVKLIALDFGCAAGIGGILESRRVRRVPAETVPAPRRLRDPARRLRRQTRHAASDHHQASRARAPDEGHHVLLVEDNRSIRN